MVQIDEAALELEEIAKVCYCCCMLLELFSFFKKKLKK